MLFGALAVSEKQTLLVAAIKKLSEGNENYYSCKAILETTFGDVYKDDITKVTRSGGTVLKMLADDPSNNVIRIRNASDFVNRQLGTYLYRYNFN